MLADQDLSVVLNTARSAAEVREYCEAFGLAGGIAEHGSYVWDALNRRERILLSPEALAQLEALGLDYPRFQASSLTIAISTQFVHSHTNEPSLG